MTRLRPLVTSCLWLLATIAPSAARPTPSDPFTNATVKLPHDVARFPNGTWVENIAVRQNGNLLVTLFTPPELWEIDPFASKSANSSRLVYHFQGAGSVTGITETAPDLFMVAADTTIWRFDFRSGGAPRASQAANVVDAGLINGMATLEGTGGAILAADSRLGLVWRIDTRTGAYDVALQDSTMAPTNELGQPLGINGVRITRDYVYYNNSPRRLLCRVRIDPATGDAIGSYEVVAKGALSDDFALRPDGTAFLAGLNDNVITKVRPDGALEVIYGNLNSTDVAGATSAAFGRTLWDYDTLYVTTSGASAAPVNGTFSEGGKVVAVKP